MLSSSQQKHFYNRAAFGSQALANQSQKTIDLFKKGIEDKPIQVVTVPEHEYEGKPEEKIAQKKNKEDQIKLNTAWFVQLTDSQAVFREKMTFFWHDHFACRARNPFLAQKQINTIRTHALGKFGNLLMEVSKDPAMLQFLNNQQNRKGSPNENFAREVMELFTLGPGNYTEDDIKNAARAFTGWGFSQLSGEFDFKIRQHDFDTKTFRNKTGNFSGEDIIQMILEDKQTAYFITAKICDFLVGEGVEKVTLEELSKKFYESDYDIQELITGIYSSGWFYENKFVGNRIKSPVELIAGIQVHTGGVFNNLHNLIYLQKALGQVLLQPPNVGGWPSGKQWIDSSSITFRLSLPTLLLRKSEITFQGKDDGDVNDATNAVVKPGPISFSIDWEKFGSSFKKGASSQTIEAIENLLLSKPTTENNRKMISSFASSGTDDVEYLKRACTGFMSLPEYQLC